MIIRKINITVEDLLSRHKQRTIIEIRGGTSENYFSKTFIRRERDQVLSIFGKFEIDYFCFESGFFIDRLIIGLVNTEEVENLKNVLKK